MESANQYIRPIAQPQNTSSVSSSYLIYGSEVSGDQKQLKEG